jgi:hypothetical protein
MERFSDFSWTVDSFVVFQLVVSLSAINFTMVIHRFPDRYGLQWMSNYWRLGALPCCTL